MCYVFANRTYITQGNDIKKKQNGYKIVYSKYNDKIYLNMDKLLNKMEIEAAVDGGRIIYTNKANKDTIDLLMKRYKPSQKYSKRAIQIFNDLNQLSGMAKKRNRKSRLVGHGPIILTPQDKQIRIEVLRGSIIAGNDNKSIYNELKLLTTQDIYTNNTAPGDLYHDLKNLTAILKTAITRE